METWSEFPTELRTAPELAGWDFFFFGYDGMHTEAVSSAFSLRKFLNDLSSDPTALFKNSDSSKTSTRRHPPRYDRIILVAHSLGALVARRAMLDALNCPKQASWPERTELILFAPAHNGAKIITLVSETIGAFRGVLTAVNFLGKLIVLEDLREGSRTLINLKDDLKRLFDGGQASLRARLVVTAKNDAVVRNATLYPDFSPEELVASHQSVCKPNAQYFDPLTILLGALKKSEDETLGVSHDE